MASEIGLARRAFVAPQPVGDSNGDGARWTTVRCGRADLLSRLHSEWKVLRRIWLPLVLCLIFMFYGAGLVFRNIAFHRYKGLEYYADLVVPQSANISVDSALVVSTRSGETLPLREALRSNWSTRKGVNVSVSAIGGLANLSALQGRPFNLADVASETLWDLSDHPLALFTNEVVAQGFQYAVIAFCMLTFVCEFHGCERPCTIAMWYRLQRTLTTVHVLRVPTYLATTIPGAAIHCQSKRWTAPNGQHGTVEVGQAHVQTVNQWFFDTYNLTHNSSCGDLVFSGHTATAMTNAIFVHYYARRILPGRCRSAAIGIAWFIFSVQIFFVLCTRNHYTMDVVIAMYVAPLNFIANLYFFPGDLSPDTDAQAEGGDHACEGHTTQEDAV